MFFNNEKYIGHINPRPASQYSHRQVSKSPSRPSSRNEAATLKKIYLVSNSVLLSNDQATDKYYTPKIDKTYKKRLNSSSVSPGSKTTSRKRSKKPKGSDNKGAIEYLPSLESQEIQRITENLIDQEQSTLFSSPKKENLYLRKIKLQEDFNQYTDENVKTKTRIQGLEGSIMLMSKRLAELREQQRLDTQSRSVNSRRRLESPQEQRTENNEQSQILAKNSVQNIASIKDLRSNLKKQNDECTYKEEQIQNLKNVLKYTEIGVLEDQRMNFFEKVIKLRQNLDKNLLHNKIGQMIKENNQDGVEKVYNERVFILEQDKKNLADQYQKLWSFNQTWIQKIEEKQLEKHDLKVSLREINDKISRSKKEYQKLVYNRNQKCQSPPKVLARVYQKQQEDNKIKDLNVENETLSNIMKEKERSLIKKEDEIGKYEKRSKEELGEVKVVNSDLRNKILELRKQNDELFRQIRIRTQKIIETPEYQSIKKRRSMMEGSQDDNILGSARQFRKLSDLLQADEELEGFEFSSMNRNDVIARLNIYKMELKEQHDKIQGIIRGSKGENELSDNPIEKRVKTPVQPLTSHEIENKKVQNDNFEDLPLDYNKKQSQKLIDTLSMKNPYADNDNSEQIKQDQGDQYNKKQENLLNCKKEEEIYRLKEIEMLEEQKNLLLKKQIEIEKLEELKRQYHEKEIVDRLTQQQEELELQKAQQEQKLKKMINNENNAGQKNKMNNEMSDNDNMQYTAQQSDKLSKGQQTKRLSALSFNDWKMIQKHIEQSIETGDKNDVEKIISQTVQSITEPSMTEGEQFEIEYLNNPKLYVDQIITKFDYDKEKRTYLSLINSRQYKQFPNQTLKNRHLEKNVTQNQINFLEDVLNFDFYQFSGDIRLKRAEKSLNNQKYLMSNQPFADQVILQGQEFDFTHYMNSEDLTRTCEEHFTIKNIPGNFNLLLQNEAFTKQFIKNFLIMQDLNKDQFIIGDKLPGYVKDKAYKGLIAKTQQQVSILKIEISQKEDLIMYQQDINIISQMNNPFILHPIASFLDNFNEQATFYRIYPPFKWSLKEHLQRNLQKMSYEEKLILSLQICMGVFSIHCKNIVMGGQIDLENIVILENEKGSQFVKFTQIFSQNVSSESDIISYFSSPESQYNRTLEFRSDIYSLGLLLYKIFTNTESSDKKKILSDPKVPKPISKVLSMCLQDNYRDRISSSGLCIYIQYLVGQENPEIVEKLIFSPMQLLDKQDGLFSESYKILPYENIKLMPVDERGVVYLENGCYYGTLNKNKQFHCEKSYIFQYDTLNKAVSAFVSNFQNGLYSFSFLFNTRLETFSIYERESNSIWFADSNTQQLIETKSYKGFTIIPEELQASFMDFVIQKNFKLIDDAGNIVIGEFGQNGLNGIGCKLNCKSKNIQIGIYEGNQFDSDGIHYHQSRIYNYMPQKDYKLKDRGMCELSNSLQIGPLKQPKHIPSIFLKYTDNKEVKAKIIRNTANYRIEYILMNELVVLCMQNQKLDDPSQERILVVLDKDLKLHSFLPASNTVQISDMVLQDGYLGIALNIDGDDIYIGHFTQNSKELEKNELFLNQGYYFNTDEIKKISCIEIKKTMQLITLI